ncbi:hypothetical protein CU254_14765 [Amycolatopsis sp. AA4]|uniref:hypothetical protein n=1 Tax=Actinomycetes TaxID=1760 RepID=UPI0001B55013|nr:MULTISPECIES: hypothetical protein [Actinomycetes]ATY11580.1 hypothetical protein CU254_14765 [Amycolatopsis sp. AA4]EFL07223.1 predicted protein [Streptomyces sp. AA4]
MPSSRASIDFGRPATLDELIAALQQLRAKAGGHAEPRFTSAIEFDTNGPRVTGVNVEVPDSGPVIEAPQ